jgi:hypothetical protein
MTKCLSGSRSSRYAEPVVASQLEQGEIYFMLSYLDNHMLVPDLKTLVFLGRDVTGNADSLLYFQDTDSYITIGPFPKNSPGAGSIFHCSDDQLKGIFLLEKATDELRRCVARRSRKQPGQYEFCDSPGRGHA